MFQPCIDGAAIAEGAIKAFEKEVAVGDFREILPAEIITMAGPTILFKKQRGAVGVGDFTLAPFGESKIKRIGVDIIGEVGELLIAHDSDTFVSSFKKGASPFMSQVEVFRIAHVDFVHEARDAMLDAGTQEQMVMVRHERERMNVDEEFP